LIKLDRFTAEERRFIRNITIPKLQEFLDNLEYTYEGRLAPIEVLRQRKGDCMEGAAFAMAVLLSQGKDTFIIDLRAPDDEDHILCVYRDGKHLGSLAKSKFMNLRGRSPVYRNLRELALSYFEHYFNYEGKLTLREYSVPLRPKGEEWLYDGKMIADMDAKTDRIRHHPVIREVMLPPVCKKKFWSEIQILPKGTKVAKRYQ